MVKLEKCKLWDIWVDASEHFMTIATTRNAAIRNVKNMIKDWGRAWDESEVTHIDYYELTPNNTLVLES